MEKEAFIAKAKKIGLTEADLHEFFETYARLEATGEACSLDDFFNETDGVLTSDEVDILTIGPVF